MIHLFLSELLTVITCVKTATLGTPWRLAAADLLLFLLPVEPGVRIVRVNRSLSWRNQRKVVKSQALLCLSGVL